MRRTACALLFVVVLAVAGPARADALTPGDYQWLKANLNVARDNSVVATLTDAQQTKLHALIASGKGKPDDRRLAIAQYLAQTVSDSFAATMKQSEQ